MIDTEWRLQSGRVRPGAALYAGPAFDEALSRLLFLVEQQRQCGVLFGPVGAGKSVLLREFCRIVRRSSRELAVVDLHQRTDQEVLWDLCGELGLSPDFHDSPYVTWRRVLDHFQSGRGIEAPTVVVFDHVDRGGEGTSGLVARLSHLALQGQGLTVILAVRANQFSDLPESLRLATELRIELGWYDREQVSEFIQTVFEGGGRDVPPFDTAAIDRLQSLSQGSPRVLSQLCDLSLMAAMAEDEQSITEQTVLTAAADLQFTDVTGSRDRSPAATPWR